MFALGTAGGDLEARDAAADADGDEEAGWVSSGRWILSSAICQMAMLSSGRMA